MSHAERLRAEAAAFAASQRAELPEDEPVSQPPAAAAVPAARRRARPASIRWLDEDSADDDDDEGHTAPAPAPAPAPVPNSAARADGDGDGDDAPASDAPATADADFPPAAAAGSAPPSRPPSERRGNDSAPGGASPAPAAAAAGPSAVSAAAGHARPMPTGPSSCRSVDLYEKLHKIDEGTYGVVYKARERSSGEIVALKQVKLLNTREGFPTTALREINVLLELRHPHVINVREMVVGASSDKIFMVMDFMDHDLKKLMLSMNPHFSASEVKRLMLDLTSAVAYCHSHYVLHRDLKTSNLLFNNRGEVASPTLGSRASTATR